MKTLSDFEEISFCKGIFTATKSTLRCSAILLNDSSICLFSPVKGLSESSIESINNLGEVKFLLAPNHYHNNGLEEYIEHFPNATLCAPTAAHKRLEKVTGLKFENLDKLKKALPKDIMILEPEGLKTGEIWLRRALGKSSAWLVVDAFGGAKPDLHSNFSSSINYLKTFPKMGVADKSLYQEWLIKRINSDNPTTIIPCHGSIIKNNKLPQDTVDLALSVFG